MHDPPQVINTRVPHRLRGPEVVDHRMDVQLRGQVVGGDVVDDTGEILDYDFACELGKGSADLFHGAALGGADVDDEDSVLNLSLGMGLFCFGCDSGGERGEFGVEGVDAYRGDSGPFTLLRDGSLLIGAKKGGFGPERIPTLIPMANFRMFSGVRPITLIQSCPSMPYVHE